MQNGAFVLPIASTVSPIVSYIADTTKCSPRFSTGFSACWYGRTTITDGKTNWQCVWLQWIRSIETQCKNFTWRCRCGGCRCGHHRRRQENGINNIAAKTIDDKCIFVAIWCKWYDAKRQKYCNNGTYLACLTVPSASAKTNLLFYVLLSNERNMYITHIVQVLYIFSKHSMLSSVCVCVTERKSVRMEREPVSG